MTSQRPKIGLALSGSSARVLAHVGVLEVLNEHDISIDFIAGCSSGALAAVSFATGTTAQFKQIMSQMTWRKLLKLWSVRESRGGLFNFRKADSELNKLTKNLNFEDIKHPKLAFTAADLYTGNLETLASGSLNLAIKATVAMPGMFVPVLANGKLLVDGGLVNVVPTQAAHNMGADIVIGVKLATANFIYEKKVGTWLIYKSLTRRLSARVRNNGRVPGGFAVLAKAIDYSFKIQEEWDEQHQACDLMIEPRVKHYGRAQFSVVNQAYLEGRRAAEEAMPKIIQIIHEFKNGK